MNANATFLWHDYETFGATPLLDRPAQFAAIRTTTDLKPIGEPLNWYCQPPTDILPHPVASLITGLTPQEVLKKGLPEAKFAKLIHAEMMEPNTCVAGYNSIHFDDEVSRNLFYRNFYDPYEREYKNSNSRWDLIDLIRMCYALRPQGIEWPLREDGMPSFKLEHLSSANQITHQGAHEALSDVWATIGMAQLVKNRQPRLFEWALAMRNQQTVIKMLDPTNPEPVLHTSSRIPASRGCTTMVLPLCVFPDRAKSVIVYDLMTDPTVLINSTADEISDLVFISNADLPEGVERIPLKAIHCNHVPMVAPISVLKGVDCLRIQLDYELCMQNAEKLKLALPGLRTKIMDVFRPYPGGDISDPDHMIYAGGFFSRDDRNLMNRILTTSADQLSKLNFQFNDSRLEEMLFRYRARNFPETLSVEEDQRWQTDRLARLHSPSDSRQLNFESFAAEIAQARATNQADTTAQKILDQLEDWGRQLARP
jgi:exodeoxyribonuclease-1